MYAKVQTSARRLERLFACALLCLVALPAAAQITSEAPYRSVTGMGRNNLVDTTAGGACNAAGCRNVDQVPCAPSSPCNLARVPEGRCSRGNNSGCLWPNGAGFCLADANIGCVVDGDCPTGTCDTVSLIPACACQGTDSTAPSYEIGVCGSTARSVCSDGDPYASEGTAGTALCSDLIVIQHVVAGCGDQAGDQLSGLRYPVENPRLTFVPQRQPGGRGLDLGVGSEIRELIETRTVGFEDPNTSTGVRRIVEFSDSYWSDAELDLLLPGTTYSTSLRSLCPGVPGEPAALSGSCSVTLGACTTHQECVGADTVPGTADDAADRCEGVEYCHGLGVDPVGFIWTDPGFDPNDPGLPPTCPPLCGTTDDRHTFEQEQLQVVADLDRRAALQLALDELAGSADHGDAVSVRLEYELRWIGGSLDPRCFIDGADASSAAAGLVGRCSASTVACNPDNFTPSVDCGPGELCSRCSTSVNQAGICSHDGSPCQVAAAASPDCGGLGTCVLPANPNLPGGFDDHGFPVLSPAHRIGVIDYYPPDVVIPMVLTRVTGDVAAELRDNDQLSAKDGLLLGEVTGGGIGIGAGRTFTNGVSALPAFPGYTCCEGGGDIAVAMESPGLPLDKLMRTHDWAPGLDGVPGCIGDNDPFNLPMCDVRPGPLLGNSGADDRSTAAFIGLCSLTCIGAGSTGSGERGWACGPGSYFDGDGVTGNGEAAGEPCDLPPVGGADGSVCGCGGGSSLAYDAHVLPNPEAPYPTFRFLSAFSARDLSVLVPFDTDLIRKERGTAAPWVGACTSDGSQCARDADCPAAGACQDIRLRPVSQSGSCLLAGGDTDQDGICDDGDVSGVAGDNPCSCPTPGAPGCTTLCDDNCPVRANPDQLDQGGVQSFQYTPGNGAPDGIGDLCQCGDVNADGVVNGTDVVLYRRKFAGQVSPFSTDLCSVTGPSGTCDGSDVVVMRRTFGGQTMGILGPLCAAALGVPDPGFP